MLICLNKQTKNHYKINLACFVEPVVSLMTWKKAIKEVKTNQTRHESPGERHLCFWSHVRWEEFSCFPRGKSRTWCESRSEITSCKLHLTDLLPWTKKNRMVQSQPLCAVCWTAGQKQLPCLLVLLFSHVLVLASTTFRSSACGCTEDTADERMNEYMACTLLSFVHLRGRGLSGSHHFSCKYHVTYQHRATE